MIIKRDYARQRTDDRGDRPSAGLLSDFDFLLWVNDFSRVGAVRFRDDRGTSYRSADGARETPALVQLSHLLSASKAVEENTETARDLEYLRGNGTSLGGLRPKCSLIDSSTAMVLWPLASFRACTTHGP